MVFLRNPGLAYVIPGTILLTLGVGTRFVALGQLGVGYSGAIIIREDQALVRTGIYRLVRHPLQLALLVELLGMIVFTESWWLSPIWVLLAVVIHFRNMHEDQVLRESFGDQALEYQATTPGMNVLLHIFRQKRPSRVGKS